jgi:hypothetical protein
MICCTRVCLKSIVAVALPLLIVSALEEAVRGDEPRKQSPDQIIEQILHLPGPERNQALAAMLDRGALAPPEKQDLDVKVGRKAKVAGCPSLEDSDRIAALRAVRKASSGAEFLHGEAEAADLLSEAQRRLLETENTPAQSDDPLLAELLRRRDKDQSIRRMWGESLGKPVSPLGHEIFSANSGAIMCQIDHDNTAWLKEQLARIGWFDSRQYGWTADITAWLMVQHADDEVDFQERVLATLKRLVREGGTNLSNYAYLYDRVAVNRRRPQAYGTQGRCVGDEWQPRTIERPEELDSRRAQIGLEPEDEYRKGFKCGR